MLLLKNLHFNVCRRNVKICDFSAFHTPYMWSNFMLVKWYTRCMEHWHFLSFYDGFTKFVHGHVRSTPGTVHCEESQSYCTQIVRMTVIITLKHKLPSFSIHLFSLCVQRWGRIRGSHYGGPTIFLLQNSYNFLNNTSAHFLNLITNF